MYAWLVRSASLASLLLPFLLTACQSEELGGVEASVVRAQLDVNPAQADALANLDVTVELQAREQPEEVTLSRATITAQPVTDASDSLTFDAHMVNTQSADPTVRMAKGETVVVRVLNDGTTNGDLAAWCRRPVELEIVVETADGEEASTTANVSVGCP